MEQFSSYLDLPVSDMQMKMVGHVQNNSAPQYFSVSNEQMGIIQPVSCNSASEPLMVPINQNGDNVVSGGTKGSNPILTSDQLGAENANILTREKSTFPVKRKAEVGPLLHNNAISQPSPFPSKRPDHTPVRSELASPGNQSQSLLNKKTVRNDSMTGKSAMQQGQNAKKQATRTVSASKSRSESSEAIRSKMRESLAAALELAFQKPEGISNTEKDKTDVSVTDQMPVNSQASGSNLSVGGVGSGSVALSSKESIIVDKSSDVNDLLSNESSVNGGKIFEEFQFGSFLPDEDVSFTDNFFAKDDLLQGNGLSWAFEFDTQMREAKQAQDAETLQPVKQEDYGHQPVKHEDYGHQPMKQEDRKEDVQGTPNDLANEIEAELFKLFGGANKKYKEKGRSLLFNLKDRNNPELRERVMSGEISPERLCSMSAEELASKELCEWRMAKAEEMAQMVVLPDIEVDVRRLVKKTHKGEYQVEFERDDVIVSEVSGGTSVLTQPLPKKEEHDGHIPPKESTREKNIVVGNQDVSSSLIIPTDGTDFMQGIMVDEIKDPSLLPPIVSLDEFMESLNAEPPFENISAAEDAKNHLISTESPKAVNNSPNDASYKKADTNKREVGTLKKSVRTSPKQKVIPSTPLKVEYIWQGKLQLNIASAVTVGGVFQSGEKTSTKEWSTSLEVKGKVKIDAFEKFLQDLPMSRTRAVMVLLIVLKDKTFDDDRANLSEAVNSYTEEQRLGYAEPAPGVELYLCPPAPKTIEMLNKHMPKHALTNDTFENELIGVVVWRRAHLSNTISPNTTSHHKHTSKKQSFDTPTTKRVQDSPNINADVPNRTPPGCHNAPRPNPEHLVDEDDDIPPGFGPVAAACGNKDDDDLPEFNFSGHLNLPASHILPRSVAHGVEMPQRPVDQVRELIKKYGQSDATSAPVTNNSLNIEPWDDDDDIPEWRPEAPNPLLHPTYDMAVHARRPPAHLYSSDRHMAPGVSHPLPGGSGQQPQPGGRWSRPPGPLHGARWRPY